MKPHLKSQTIILTPLKPPVSFPLMADGTSWWVSLDRTTLKARAEELTRAKHWGPEGQRAVLRVIE